MNILGKISATIFALPFVFIMVILIGIKACEVRNAHWDKETQKLCDNDPESGITIYETRSVEKGKYPSQYNAYGNFKLPSKTGSTRGDANFYYMYMPRDFIREGSPQIFRSEFRVMDASSETILSKSKSKSISISYRREGGHFYASWLSGGKSFHCPKTDGTDIIGQTLVLENEI